MNQTLALTLIAVGFVIAGWLDGNDAAMAEKSSAVQYYSVSQSGKQIACIDCAGGVK